MVGLGTMQPVAETFKLARQLAPRLRKVGVAWNPSEANSKACTKIARTVCKELMIELLEANVDGSAAVREAVASLIGRGAEAIWIGGDNVVLSSLDAVIGPAQAGRVPVFSSVPGCARGVPCSIWAPIMFAWASRSGGWPGACSRASRPRICPFFTRSRPSSGSTASRSGRWRGEWSIPPEIDAKADVVVENGKPVRRHALEELATPAAAPSRPSRTWKIALAAYSDTSSTEEALEGFRRGLKEAGLNDGRDFTINYRNGQGDIATLNSLFDELSGNDSDLVVTFSTTALQTALRKIDRKPVVFGVVLDPIAAGAGKSDSDHKKGVTGVYLGYPYLAMVQTIRQVLPKARRVGTLFTPGEINSVLAQKGFVAPLKAAGLELVSLPVNGPTEVADAALSVCQSGVDVFCQLSDNLSSSSFPAIARACAMAKTPLFTFAHGSGERGCRPGSGFRFRGQWPRDRAAGSAGHSWRRSVPNSVPRHGQGPPHGQPGQCPAVRRLGPARVGRGRRLRHPPCDALKDASWTAASAAPIKSPNWSWSAVSTRPGPPISRTRSTR